MMRLHATRESADAGEVSVLAIVETVLAMSASLFVVWHFHYTTHLIVAAFVAPLLLLRTPESTELGLKMADRAFEAIEDWFDRILIKAIKIKDVKPIKNDSIMSKRIMSFTAYCVAATCVFIIFLAIVISIISVTTIIKITSITATLTNHPIASIQSIKTNFTLATLSTDSTITPEMITGISDETHASTYYNAKKFTFKSVSTVIFSGNDTARSLVVSAIMAPIILLMFIPPITYRLSIKSTAVIWLPLIWITSPVRAKDTLVQVFTDLRDMALQWVLRMVAALVAGGWLVKIGLMIAMVRMGEWWASHPQAELFTAYIQPDALPVWQVASVANGILGWALYFWADRYLIRVRTGRITSESPTARNTYNLISLLRNGLTFYTLICTIYIVVTTARSIPWPDFDFRWLPWL